jgi:hypothetical protein
MKPCLYLPFVVTIDESKKDHSTTSILVNSKTSKWFDNLHIDSGGHNPINKNKKHEAKRENFAKYEAIFLKSLQKICCVQI